MPKSDKIQVVSVPEMSDDNFRLHLEHRHIPPGDFADLKAFHGGTTFSSNRSTHASYHLLMHRKHPERYDHVHP